MNGFVRTGQATLLTTVCSISVNEPPVMRTIRPASAGNSPKLAPVDGDAKSGNDLRCVRSSPDRLAAAMGETSGGSEVLVVEDDETIRESLCELLANELYDPIGCRSGEVAWTRLVSGLRPSVMVVDLALERMSGRELLKLLRGTVWGQTIPVLLLSGWHSPERFGDHADAVLGKDVDGTSIIRTIDRLALRGRRVETSEQDQPGQSMAAASC